MKQNKSEYNQSIDEEENNNKNISNEKANNQIDAEHNQVIPNNYEDQTNQIENNNINQNTTEINLSQNIDNNNIFNDNCNNSEINSNIINNNKNENINNQIDDGSLDVPEREQEIEPEIYNPKFTFSFKLFFILNTLAYIHSKFNSYQLKNYTLCLYPIINKQQYYRLVSSHFYHFGFFDYLSTMLGFFFATKYLEKEIGSIYTILIIFHGIILTSVFYIIVMWIFRTLFRFSEYQFNFIFQCGFSSIDFCLFLSYFLLKKNFTSNLSFSFIDLRGIHAVYFVILLFQLITPSASIIFNLCGTLSSALVFKVFKYFSFPRNYWIRDIEKIFGLHKIRNCCIKKILGFISINENEIIINNVKELDYFIDNLNREKYNDSISSRKSNNISQENGQNNNH